MPNLLAEAMDAGEEKKGAKKKKAKLVVEVEVPSDSDKEESDDNVEGDTGKGCNCATFKLCNPPPFDGTQDAAATQQWLREMKVFIWISECNEDQKVKFASHSFGSKALC
jgi:hypothetical protein